MGEGFGLGFLARKEAAAIRFSDRFWVDTRLEKADCDGDFDQAITQSVNRFGIGKSTQ